ncbi:nucleotidyltransferase domain-containing protein [Thermosulfurimonas sp. F29]|uniref:nucleotidyltransferase domain-containing protein n=1 Tax=Thermosulfurimonas sp. F29 TaxID=2867247 RepID=UPI001C83B91E|nr:nucleotidyltransferase domain-containing protein [Thermosulfurimonas sp. F29]MBX6422283.1 hypothetical protein [Thermosulfurimonas sp. F29]
MGSDLDVVVLVRETGRPFPERRRDFPAEDLPVPVDLVVYSLEEWRRMKGRLRWKIRWLKGRPDYVGTQG